MPNTSSHQRFYSDGSDNRWRKGEQPLRVGLFITGSALGNLIGIGVDFGAITIKGTYAAEPWKWIYVIFGSITIGYGILTFLAFPSTPMTAWFLTDRERIIAVRRVAKNATGVRSKKFKGRQLLEAAKDPQLYLLAIFSFSFAFVNNAVGA